MKTWLFPAITIATLLPMMSTNAPQSAAVPTVRAGNAGMAEGQAGTRKVDVCVMLSQPAPGPITVTYATRDGSASGGTDYQTANGTVSFAKGDTCARVPLNVIGDRTIEANETFELVLTAATGATVAARPGVVTIVNDDFPAGQPGPPAYWVSFDYRGSSGSLKGVQGCPVSELGWAKMYGVVEGSERVASDDDIEYKGSLWLDTDIDLCEADRFNGSSEDKLCSIRVTGFATINAELSVYADSRGGWIKGDADPNSVAVWTSGSCTAGFKAEEKRVYPDHSMAHVFQAAELKIPSGPLRAGRSYPAPDEPSWVFNVVAKLR